eukprot:6201590-Pleurochrysis_carterae.AAC.2
MSKLKTRHEWLLRIPSHLAPGALQRLHQRIPQRLSPLPLRLARHRQPYAALPYCPNRQTCMRSTVRAEGVYGYTSAPPSQQLGHRSAPLRSATRFERLRAVISVGMHRARTLEHLRGGLVTLVACIGARAARLRQPEQLV